MDVTIIIPAYNEEEAIGVFLTELLSGLKTNLSWEVIVVNDGSSDRTPEIVKAYDVKLLNHASNKGYGAALKTGIKESIGRNILICDSDGQHTIEDINKIISIEGSLMVVGQRGSDSHVQGNRIAGKTILRLFANFLMGEKIPDLNSGLRLIDSNTIKKYLHILPDSFSASTTMTMLFLKRKYDIRWEKIVTKERIGNSSVRQITHGLYTILLMMRILMLFNPLKIFMTTSVAFFTFGFLWGLYHLADGGGLSIFAAVYLILSVQLFLYGLIADQISMQRLEKYE
jgi:glycosyltransferase involved in cell wall biosynthesis